MATENAEWVCPWGICARHAAEACRAEMSVTRGCGGRFPDMTSEQAKAEISRTIYTPPYAPRAPITPLTEDRVREIVSEELAKHDAGVSPCDRQPK